MVNTSGQTAVVAMQDKIFPAQFTVAGSAATGAIYTATLYPFGFQNPATSTSFQVPAGSTYQLVDLYVTAAPSVDAQIIFQLNGVAQGQNFILSTVVAGNSGRAKMTQPLVIRPSDVFTVQVVTTAANTLTTSVTETCYLQFLQVPTS